MRETRYREGWQAQVFLPSLVVLLALGACEFDVTNPGPIQDEGLNDPIARSALIGSAEKALSFGMAFTTNRGAVVARELVASGLTGGAGAGAPAGVPTMIRQGLLTGAQDVGDQEWIQAQRARFIAEDMRRRLQSILSPQEFDSSPDAARAHLFVGYTNRILGENMCDAVIDGGVRQDHTTFLERARDAFTAAVEAAGRSGDAQLRLAGLAGRASAHAWLGAWADAVADAQEVPTDFRHVAPYHTVDESQWNRMANSTGRQWRAMSVWNTFYEDYYMTTGDPRVPWEEDPDFEFGTPAPEGDVPYFRQLKQPNIDSPINLSTGREMRLIEAEALLVANDWSAAVDRINDLRESLRSDHTGEPLEPWTPQSADEAWAALQRERGIELWLEGRRLGDIRRWRALGRPDGGLPDMTGRSECFPIGETELLTNPNL